MAHAHANGMRLRPVGAAVSPNGIGLNGEGMVSVKTMDRILHIDTEKVCSEVSAPTMSNIRSKAQFYPMHRVKYLI